MSIYNRPLSHPDLCLLIQAALSSIVKNNCWKKKKQRVHHHNHSQKKKLFLYPHPSLQLNIPSKDHVTCDVGSLLNHLRLSKTSHQNAYNVSTSISTVIGPNPLTISHQGIIAPITKCIPPCFQLNIILALYMILKSSIVNVPSSSTTHT